MHLHGLHDGKTCWGPKVHGNSEQRFGVVDPTEGVVLGLVIGSPTIGFFGLHRWFLGCFVLAFRIEWNTRNGVADRTHTSEGVRLHLPGEDHRQAAGD